MFEKYIIQLYDKNITAFESVLKNLEICNTTMFKSHFQKKNCEMLAWNKAIIVPIECIFSLKIAVFKINSDVIPK